MSEVKTSNSSLTYIDVSKCHKLTEQGILTFLAECNPKLKGFLCSHLKSATDTSLARLAKMPNIDTINVSYCRGLTKDFFESFKGTKQKFKALMADGCGPVNSDFLQMFENSKNTLTQLSLQSFKFVSYRNTRTSSTASFSSTSLIALTWSLWTSLTSRQWVKKVSTLSLAVSIVVDQISTSSDSSTSPSCPTLVTINTRRFALGAPTWSGWSHAAILISRRHR